LTLCYQPTAECITVIAGKARGLKAKDINGLSGGSPIRIVLNLLCFQESPPFKLTASYLYLILYSFVYTCIQYIVLNNSLMRIHIYIYVYWRRIHIRILACYIQ